MHGQKRLFVGYRKPPPPVKKGFLIRVQLKALKFIITREMIQFKTWTWLSADELPVPFLIWHIDGMSIVYIFRHGETVPKCTWEAICPSLSMYATTSGLYGRHFPCSLNHSHTTTPFVEERGLPETVEEDAMF